VKPGDVIWTPPGVKHWHGATATAPMTHIAIQGLVDGKNVDWKESVTDRAKYRGSSYLGPMIAARARSATLKVTPREMNARQRDERRKAT
jgi:hypothetical protein